MPCEKKAFDLELWWYDAYEDFNKGTVYLFGKSYNDKSNCYESCCVQLQGIQREIYILPRQYKTDDNGDQTNEKVSLDDVENELALLLQRKGIESFQMQTCSRKYAFGTIEIPAEATYIKLNYSYKDYELPTTLNGRTFSHIFGANTGPLEHWIVQRHIMGPCWIRVTDALIADGAQSWCKLNTITTGIHTCTVIEQERTIPPLTILSLNAISYMNPYTNSNEIVAVSGFVRKNVAIDEADVTPIDATCFTFVRLLPKTEYTENMINAAKQTPNHHIFLEATEKALLNGLINTIHRLDPDILVGHDFYGICLNLLLCRMKHLDIVHWHKIGRIRHRKWPKSVASSSSALLGESSFQERRMMAGRIVCDTFMASKDLIKSKSYDLTELASSQLHVVRHSIEPHQLRNYFSQDGDRFLLLLNHCLYDAFLAYQLMTKMNVLLLTKQLTNVSGNLWSHTLHGARLERNEYLLLHTFYQKGFVYPDKTLKEQKMLQFTDEAKNPKNPKSGATTLLSGGLVLEPKIGLYDDYVLLLDFNSLYPTIMQEFNVCFTNPDLIGYNFSSTPSNQTELCVLPELVKKFVEQRKRVKKLMQEPGISQSQKAKYEIQQMSLKLTANSMYGSLGSAVSRFQSKRLAAFITAKGREILRSTVDIAFDLGLDVIYGDTDSIMINTHQKKLMKAKAIGEGLKTHINRYHRLLEIDIDSIFRRTLLARKKKYAALAVSQRLDGIWQESVQIKGLDLVRRDWCSLSREVSEEVLRLIFHHEDQETIVPVVYQYLQQVARKMEHEEYTIDSYIIRKQLTKLPQDYMNSKSNYHVTVAKSMRRAGQMVRVGDTIAYVMCKPSNSANTSKAGSAIPCTPKEVSDGNLSIDIRWYLQKQILPPVYRICQPIHGTDIKQIADQLNVDINDLVDSLEDTIDKTSVMGYTCKNPDMLLLNDEECYNIMEPPSFICSYCSHTNPFLGPIQIEDGKIISGLTCVSCQLVMNKASVWCQLYQKLESLITQYYQRKWVCNKNGCGFSTRDDIGVYCVEYHCDGKLIPEVKENEAKGKALFINVCFFLIDF
ncbi:hypothetical protein EDC96DRAFT_433861 [Choanephora cucurbitarum]|nr:hypothetical protein EDC96DRAFT_433861 [Choanephora cucurbitarum]